MDIKNFIKLLELVKSQDHKKERLLIKIYDEDEELVKIVKTISRDENTIFINCSRF